MSSRAFVEKHSHRSRRLKRLEETQEIQIRTTHRRRKLLTRGGVLAGFAMAMGVYPVAGTIAPYEPGIDNVPGVVRGEAPTSAHAMLGQGPSLVSIELPLPSPDDQARAIALSDRYTVSQHLPDCDPTKSEFEGGNGELTPDSLCTLWNGEQLRADAAVALAELNERFKVRFGRDMCIYEGYRSLAKQYETKRRRGWLAATPGTSVHGWGLAFDLCGGDDRGETKQWLEDNGPAWGWVNPEWAKTRKWEPWHYEYLPGTDQMNIYGNSNWQPDTGSETEEPSGSDTPSTSTSQSGTNSTPAPRTTPKPEPETEPAPTSGDSDDS